MTKRMLTLALACTAVLACTVVLIPLVYWTGISAPKKEVVFKREMVQDDLTKEVLPIYAVLYKWDGIEQQVPHWMIFKKYGNWRVVELKKVSEPDEVINQSIDFNAGWIVNYGFSPQRSRYESLLMVLGFQPIFRDEKRVFHRILHEVDESWPT